MLVFVFGTSAEAIKLAPLARRLDGEGVNYEFWLTMFHGQQLIQSAERLGFRGKPVIIQNGNNGASVGSAIQAIRWLIASLSWILKNRKSVGDRLGKNSLIIVHGDTLTTVIGALYAKILRLPSAHIEAGLRSGNWRHPFPEELDRVLAGELASIHYAPTLEAVSNLSRKNNVVFTHGNTVIDSVLEVESSVEIGEGKFAVCLLHRFEFLANSELVSLTLDTLASDSPVPIRVYLDAYSGGALRSRIEELDSRTIEALDKLPYEEFIRTLQQAEFVITDSGGIQAECATLGIPTLIHRMATEQFEGVGQNILLSNWDPKVLSEFLANYRRYRRTKKVPDISPTDVIFLDLKSRGFISGVGLS
jgi:UDP-N-acetylglucosamine 2-epimerase (non-hydrolysing)